MRKKLEHDHHTNKQRQCSIAKHVGCKFAVKVICSNDIEQDIEIFVNTNHIGHEPGSKSDVFFLLLHQSAIDNCVEMLSNLNNIQLVVSHSERYKNILREKVSLYEQRTYRFFLDNKEASNLSYRLQMQERCGEDNYNVVKDMVPTWMEEERVIFFSILQSYGCGCYETIICTSYTNERDVGKDQTYYSRLHMSPRLYVQNKSLGNASI